MSDEPSSEAAYIHALDSRSGVQRHQASAVSAPYTTREPNHERMYYCDAEGCSHVALGRGLYALPEGWSRTITGDTLCPEHSS